MKGFTSVTHVCVINMSALARIFESYFHFNWLGGMYFNFNSIILVECGCTICILLIHISSHQLAGWNVDNFVIVVEYGMWIVDV